MRLNLRLNLLQSMPSLPLSESIVGQDPTTQWQYILQHKLFCPYACNECSARECASQSYRMWLHFNCISMSVKTNFRIPVQSSPVISSPVISDTHSEWCTQTTLYNPIIWHYRFSISLPVMTWTSKLFLQKNYWTNSKQAIILLLHVAVYLYEYSASGYCTKEGIVWQHWNNR